LKPLKNHWASLQRLAKAVGVARVTHYEWLKNDEEYKAKVDEIMEVQVDFVENKLIDRINKGGYHSHNLLPE